jgi:predicted ATP-dependent serine protease
MTPPSSRVLGGVRAQGTILLAGEAGAGKSTVAAELAAAVAEERSGLAYWLDRD